MSSPPIEVRSIVPSWYRWAIGLEDKGRGKDGSPFEHGKEIITKLLTMPKAECNVAPDYQYETVKYLFSYEAENKVYRIKAGPDGKAIITYGQFLNAPIIEEWLTNSALVDSMVYYDKISGAEITEEQAIENSANEDPKNKPATKRPGKRASPAGSSTETTPKKPAKEAADPW